MLVKLLAVADRPATTAQPPDTSGPGAQEVARARQGLDAFFERHRAERAAKAQAVELLDRVTEATTRVEAMGAGLVSLREALRRADGEPTADETAAMEGARAKASDGICLLLAALHDTDRWPDDADTAARRRGLVSRLEAVLAGPGLAADAGLNPRQAASPRHR